MTQYVWIIEASYDRGPWHPTVGIALTRREARAILGAWRKRNPHDDFRLARYRTAKEPKT